MKVNDRQVIIGYYRYNGVSLILVIWYRYIVDMLCTESMTALGFGQNTSSYDGEHLCPVLFNSLIHEEEILRTRKSVPQFDLWPQSVNLTLDGGTWLFAPTYHHMMVNICTKSYKIPFIHEEVMLLTQNIVWQFDLWLKCDLGGRDLAVGRDTLSHDGEHLWQVISNSLNK
jgi:hypothetical protein